MDEAFNVVHSLGTFALSIAGETVTQYLMTEQWNFRNKVDEEMLLKNECDCCSSNNIILLSMDA